MKTAATTPKTAAKLTYRAWVEGGARGFFLAPSVAVNAVRLINPLDRRGGYFVRRDTSDPEQAQRRALLTLSDRAYGERDDDYAHEAQKTQQAQQARHVIAYDSEPTPIRSGDGERDGEREGQREGWVVTARVERPSEVVRRGWLTWESVGEVVGEPATHATHAAHVAHAGMRRGTSER